MKREYEDKNMKMHGTQGRGIVAVELKSNNFTKILLKKKVSQNHHQTISSRKITKSKTIYHIWVDANDVIQLSPKSGFYKIALAR